MLILSNVKYPIWCKDPSSHLVVKFNSLYNAVVIIGDLGWKIGEEFKCLETPLNSDWDDVTQLYATKFIILASIGINVNDEYSSSVNDIFCGVILATDKDEALKIAKDTFDYEFLHNKCRWCEHYDIDYEAKEISEL